MKKQSYIFFILSLISIKAWCQQERIYRLPEPKRFISKVEIFAGPGLSFNRGNLFVENYRGEFANGNYVENKRLTKLGYSAGLGIYHQINNRIDLNLRILWEQKGYNSELSTPLGSNSRAFAESNYTYKYFTVPVTAKLFMDKKKRLSISLGGYVSRLNSMSATEKFYNTLDNTRTSSTFIGRTLVAFDADGGINSASFIPGLQGFAEYDYGTTVALNYELKLAEKHTLIIQMIDNFGLTNVNKPNFTSIPSPNERNHVISVIVGYLYQRKPKK